MDWYGICTVAFYKYLLTLYKVIVDTAKCRAKNKTGLKTKQDSCQKKNRTRAKNKTGLVPKTKRDSCQKQNRNRAKNKTGTSCEKQNGTRAKNKTGTSCEKQNGTRAKNKTGLVRQTTHLGEIHAALMM
jgi:hypothetical protein